MKICGLQKLTLLDFPGRVACTVFLGGCNFRCPFCYNAPLVLLEQGAYEEISESDLFSFLEKRRGVLDGVCVTGGEPLLSDITPFVRRIHDLGYAVKLDTNGAFPERLAALLSTQLIDYVAMDVKNRLEAYPETVGVPSFDAQATIARSIGILKESQVEYEFRTTVARELQSSDDLVAIAHLLQGAPHWYLQTYSEHGDHLGESLTPYSKAEMQDFAAQLREIVPGVETRGI